VGFGHFNGHFRPFYPFIFLTLWKYNVSSFKVGDIAADASEFFWCYWSSCHFFEPFLGLWIQSKLPKTCSSHDSYRWDICKTCRFPVTFRQAEAAHSGHTLWQMTRVMSDCLATTDIKIIEPFWPPRTHTWCAQFGTVKVTGRRQRPRSNSTLTAAWALPRHPPMPVLFLCGLCALKQMMPISTVDWNQETAIPCSDDLLTRCDSGLVTEALRLRRAVRMLQPYNLLSRTLSRRRQQLTPNPHIHGHAYGNKGRRVDRFRMRETWMELPRCAASSMQPGLVAIELRLFIEGEPVISADSNPSWVKQIISYFFYLDTIKWTETQLISTNFRRVFWFHLRIMAQRRQNNQSRTILMRNPKIAQVLSSSIEANEKFPFLLLGYWVSNKQHNRHITLK
jgi:hypothetical protein